MVSTGNIFTQLRGRVQEMHESMSQSVEQK
jgi:hypothetical protein